MILPIGLLPKFFVLGVKLPPSQLDLAVDAHLRLCQVCLLAPQRRCLLRERVALPVKLLSPAGQLVFLATPAASPVTHEALAQLEQALPFRGRGFLGVFDFPTKLIKTRSRSLGLGFLVLPGVSERSGPGSQLLANMERVLPPGFEMGRELRFLTVERLPPLFEAQLFLGKSGLLGGHGRRLNAQRLALACQLLALGGIGRLRSERFHPRGPQVIKGRWGFLLYRQDR
jgi:hypothetical protein